MQTKIQLIHPDGKNAITMDRDKYDLIKGVLLHHLRINGSSTHTEILQMITEDFKKNKVKFEGSIEWHMEWIKLDLMARNEIRRIKDISPIKFEVIKKTSEKLDFKDLSYKLTRVLPETILGYP